MFVTFYKTQIVGSTRPVTMMQQGFALEEILEKMNSDYKTLITSDPAPLITLEAKIIALPSVYGDYTSITKMITFDASENEEAAPCTVDCSILKVAVTVGEQTITTLFTR